MAFRSLSKEAHLALLRNAEDAGVTVSEFVRGAVSDRLRAKKGSAASKGWEVTGTRCSLGLIERSSPSPASRRSNRKEREDVT